MSASSQIEPLVTIAIPTRNRVSLLPRALRSARAQSYANIEIVVSNNASTDGTPVFLSEISDAKVRVYHQESMLSMLGNYNFCLDKAVGEYFLLLSDDDWIDHDFVEKCIGRIHGKPNIKWVYTQAKIHYESEQQGHLSLAGPATESGVHLIRNYFQNSSRHIWMCGTLFRTAEMRGVGGYSSGYHYAMDAAMWMELALKGDVAHVNEPLTHYDGRHSCSTDKVALSIQAAGLLFDRYGIICFDGESHQRVRASYIATKIIGWALLLREQGATRLEILRHLRLYAGDIKTRNVREWVRLTVAILFPSQLLKLLKRLRRRTS